MRDSTPFVAVFFALLLATSLFAEKFTLKNGKSFEGRILQETDSYFVIEAMGGVELKIYQAAIATIEESGSPEPESQKTEAQEIKSPKTPPTTSAKAAVPSPPMQSSTAGNSPKQLPQVAEEKITPPDKEQLSIAVGELQGKGVETDVSEILSDRLRGELVKIGIFTVLERGQMEEILQEQDFQMSDLCADEACYVEMGQILGVERMVIGSIGKIGTMYTYSLKMIDIRTGTIIHTVDEDCDCPVEDVVSSLTKKVSEKMKVLVARENYGGITVTTTPKGAAISLDGKSVGKTPWHEDLIDPGDHTIGISHTDYALVERTVTLHKGKLTELSIDLVRSEAFKDSVKTVQKAKKSTSQLIRKIGFGILAAGIGAAGVVTNFQVSDDIKTRDKAYDRYLAAESQDAADDAWNDAEKRQEALDSSTLKRNVFYGLAGACVVGFGVSFFF